MSVTTIVRIVTALMILLLMVIIVGLSQLGDCHPLEPSLSACLVTKQCNWWIAVTGCLLLYPVCLYLIFRKRKPR